MAKHERSRLLRPWGETPRLPDTYRLDRDKRINERLIQNIADYWKARGVAVRLAVVPVPLPGENGGTFGIRPDLGRPK